MPEIQEAQNQLSSTANSDRSKQAQSRVENLTERYPKTLSILGEYALGQIDYEERVGEYKVRISNLNRVIGALVISNCCIAILALFLGQRNQVQPYVAVIDKDLRVLALGKAIKGNNSLSTSVKRDQLKMWIFDTRTVLKEFDAETQFIYWAMDRTYGPATQKLQEWYETHRPNERAKTSTVTVDVEAPVPIPNSGSWEARWTETINDNGEIRIEKWTGILTVDVWPASSDDEWYKNPTGFHITDFQWSKTS